jgi:hypothetical protein
MIINRIVTNHKKITNRFILKADRDYNTKAILLCNEKWALLSLENENAIEHMRLKDGETVSNEIANFFLLIL